MVQGSDRPYLKRKQYTYGIVLLPPAIGRTGNEADPEFEARLPCWLEGIRPGRYGRIRKPLASVFVDHRKQDLRCGLQGKCRDMKQYLQQIWGMPLKMSS